MSDLFSTRAVGEAATHRLQGTAAASPVATVIVADASFRLPNLTLGTLINGVIAERGPRSTFIVKTDKGNLTLQSNLPLKVGNALVMQLQSVGTQSRVVILSVDGQAIGTPDGYSQAAEKARITGTNSSAAPQTRTGDPGDARQGTGIDSSKNPAGGSSPAAVAGQTANQKVLSRNVAPGGAFAEARAPLANGVIVPAVVVDINAPRGAGTPSGTNLDVGDALTVRVLAIARPDGQKLTPQVPPRTAASNWVHAAVTTSAADGGGSIASSIGTGKAPSANTVLAFGSARLAVNAAPPGPEGTAVLLEILDRTGAATKAEMAAPRGQRSFLELAREWPALRASMGLTDTSTAPQGNATFQPPLPTPGSALASTILFFIAALKGGDLRSWLGEMNTNQLEGMHQGQLLAQLGDDFNQLARLASEPQPSGWQIMLIPLANGDRLEQIRLFYRGRQGHGETSGESPSRFVVEAELAAFGLVQLDGLLGTHRFDLQVRSNTAFTPAMQGHIREIFVSALEIGGLQGNVQFEAGSQVSLDPFHDTAKEPGHASGLIV